jgi:hypothetical protein
VPSVDALGIAAMDEHHVSGHAVADLDVAQTLLPKVSASSSVA